MPSSAHITSTRHAEPLVETRARTAIAHGACTRAPKGESTQTRQSPISSRNRSTTIVRSSGTAPPASACSRDVPQDVVGRPRVEAEVVGEPRSSASARRGVADLTHERAEGPAELERTARPVAVPERHLAGLAGRGRHDDAFERDVLDPPRRRAEEERLAGPALVHHLLVELADALAVGQEHAEQARGRGSCLRSSPRGASLRHARGACR